MYSYQNEVKMKIKIDECDMRRAGTAVALVAPLFKGLPYSTLVMVCAGLMHAGYDADTWGKDEALVRAKERRGAPKLMTLEFTPIDNKLEDDGSLRYLDSIEINIVYPKDIS